MGITLAGYLARGQGGDADGRRDEWVQQQLARRMGDRSSGELQTLIAQLEAQWEANQLRDALGVTPRGPVPGRRARTARLAPNRSPEPSVVSRAADAAEPPPEHTPIPDTFASVLADADRTRRVEAAQYRTPGRIDRRAVGAMEDDAPERIQELLACGGGHPLPSPLAARLGESLGADVGRVRVHTGSQAAEAADAMGAAAFAHGDDIYFARGRYQPDTVEGQRLIAHEVAHTVQQRGAASAGPGELKVSEPGDSHEREADAFADAFVAPREEQPPAAARPAPGQKPAPAPSRIVRPSQAPWITPVSRRVLQAERVYRPRPDIMHSSDGGFVSVSNIDLFPSTPIFTRTWDVLPQTFVPLAGTTFLVSGVPITAQLAGTAEARTGAAAYFGPGRLEEARVYLTGSELARQRRPRWGSLPPILPIVPIPAPGPPRGRWGADAMLRMESNANAFVSASAGLEASLSLPLSVFSATAFAGISGSARGAADIQFDGYTNFTYDNGVADASITLDLTARASLDFSINAHAGVRVELRFPEIPVVNDLYRKVASWPIVNWFAPDIDRWRWRREYRKDWELFRRRYDWQIQKQLSIGGRSPGAAGRAAMNNARGFDITQMLRDLQATQRDGEMRDDPVGPGTGRSGGRAVGEVTTLAARARQAISALRQAAQREQRTNGALLREVRAAAAHASPGGGNPPAMAVGSGGGDPVQQLTDRGTALTAATNSATELTQSSTALDTPAAATDGPTRNQASEGYASIARNAEELTNAIDTSQGPYQVPAAAGPTHLGARRVPGTDQFEGSFNHPDWNWSGFPGDAIERHPVNEFLGLRQDANQSTVKPSGHYRYTGRRTTGARAVEGELRTWRRNLDDRARTDTDAILAANPGMQRRTARHQAENAIADDWAARGWPRHRFDYLKVLDHTGWECHHAHETSWNGNDNKSNLIYVSAANHTPFSSWWDRRRDDIKSHLGI